MSPKSCESLAGHAKTHLVPSDRNFSPSVTDVGPLSAALMLGTQPSMAQETATSAAGLPLEEGAEY